MLIVAAGAGLGSPAVAQNKAVPVETKPAVAQPGAKPATPAPGAGGGAATTPPPAHEIPPVTTDDPNLVTLSAFAEPVALSALVEMVATTLNVNITVLGDVPGTVVFNAPVAVKKEDLLPLLESLLEQQQFTLVQDRFGWYTVHSVNNVAANMGVPGKEDLTTTRVFRTPNMRPSALKVHLEPVIAGAAQSAKPYAYIDDLGIIIATDTPKRLDAVGSILRQMIEEFGRMEFIRFPLEHISGSTARDRALQLIGQMAQPTTNTGAPGNTNAAAAAANAANRPGGPLDNLGERLTVEQQGNALVFRGTPDEIRQVREVLAIIDVPNELIPRSYDAGSSASQVADIARNLGLGEVITISQVRSGNEQAQFFNRGQANQNQALGGQWSGLGGPMMVVDEKRGKIVYYGTESQQHRLDALLQQLDTQAEQIVIRVYKLKNAKAEDMQEIILGIIQNQTPMGEAPLLPGDTSGRPGRFRATPRASPTNPAAANQPAGSEEGLSIDSENAFVIADKANNQMIVKAPAAQQPEFARLIEKLDLRRPQVYIEAKIVAVTADDQLRTAFETQLINASGTGGVFQQNFGLSSTPTGTTGQPILNPRVVAAGLTGFTGAIIRSDQVPIIMTALANETDSRVIASPQLLVDDNEKAKVATVDSQPVAVVSRGTNGQGDIVTSGEDATAETSLEVTPHISEGGYLRMEYNIKLESFTGTPQQNLSPPKLSNNIDAASITVPSDSTVIIGGLVVDSKRKTVAKIPLLGDIPLVGLLFQDRTTNARNTVLYVFLTPKILREPTFTDLKLLTRGPQAKAGLKADFPSMSPSPSEIVGPLGAPPAPPAAMPRHEEPATTKPAPAPASPDGPSPDR